MKSVFWAQIVNSPYLSEMKSFRAIRRLTSNQLFELEGTYGATNYAPIKVAISRAEGVNVYDPEGLFLFDFKWLR